MPPSIMSVQRDVICVSNQADRRSRAYLDLRDEIVGVLLRRSAVALVDMLGDHPRV